MNIPGFENITTITLENGVTVLSFNNPNSLSIYVVGILSGGGYRDPAGKTGLAHFTASLLSRGTENITFAEFHNQLESAGANLVFSCGSQHAWFRGKSLAEDVELLFRLAAESLQNPSFNIEYIERLRNQLLTGLNIRDQDTSEMASHLLDMNLFVDHPYGEPIDGYTKTITSISRSDIVHFHSQRYSPHELIIVIAGAIQEKEIQELAAKYFSAWKNPSTARNELVPLPDPPSKVIRKHMFINGKSQVDLLLGCFGPTRTAPDYIPVFIGNNILGQFGMMGRIGKSVRSQSGLAYYASSAISAWRDAGTWEFSAGVNPENVDTTIDLIRDEIRRFVKEPVTEEELDNSKSHLIGRMPMALESNAGLANAILTMQRFNLGLDYYQKYAKRIKKVTAKQILESSRRYLHPDRLVITSAGPGEEIK